MTQLLREQGSFPPCGDEPQAGVNKWFTQRALHTRRSPMAGKKESLVLVVHEWNKMDLRKPEADARIAELMSQLEANNAGQVSVNQRMIAGDTLRMSITTSNRAQVVTNIESIENVEVIDEPVN